MVELQPSTSVEYRPVRGFPAYRVGNDGSVWSMINMGNHKIDFRWRQLDVTPKAEGRYSRCTLCDQAGVIRQCRVHDLILRAFIGPPPPGFECRHLDGNRANNRLDNIVWGTRQQNAEDKIRHDTVPRGTDHWNGRLSDDQVLEIRRLLSEGVMGILVAERFGVSTKTISKIKHGRLHRRV